MALQHSYQISLADIAVNKRKCKNKFFEQIDSIIDWSEISHSLTEFYPKGYSQSGRKAYPPLLLFKMMLLQTWYGLSDYQVEEEVNDRITFSKFCGLSIDNDVPDHSVLSRFRTVLTEKNALDQLFEMVNKQLARRNILILEGSAAVDASITSAPRKPKGKKTYDLDKNGEIVVSESYQKGVDKEANWTKKNNKLFYGYKKHVAVDSKEGLVLAVKTTKASTSDSTQLLDVLKKTVLKPGSRIYADKGYSGRPNEDILKTMGLRSGILKKASKNRRLKDSEKRFNIIISKTRYKVERFFGSIKRWFKSSEARYIGLAKMHTQNMMEALAYNLYRSPNIIIKNLLKP